MASPDHRLLLRAVACLAAVLALLATTGNAVAGPLSRPTASATSRVIVQVQPAARAAAHTLVARLGGTVGRQLDIVNGFAASVPASSVGRLGSAAGVRAATTDERVHVQAVAGSGSGDDMLSAYPAAIWADEVWQTGDRGQGVTVALVDTGEADCNDNYGHGTFVAGIIAGDGTASGGRWTGVAPRANIVSVKVAGRDGSADVSGVLAAIQWVVSFKDRYGIRVLNLSLGTGSTQSYRNDPLDYAVERAWDAGIAVVVAASNLGPAPGTITKPGDDPLPITVGAVDDRGTADVADDELPNSSSRGPTAADGLAKPDVVAPGAHIVSLRSVGSTIDEAFPGSIDGSYHRGVGTSFGTAAVSGVIALMCSHNPGMTPDIVKFAVSTTARPVASTDRMAVGADEVDAYAATVDPPAGVANAGVARSNGTGLLDVSRGHVRVQTSANHVLVNGLLTAQLVVWNPTAFLLNWSPTSWFVSTWNLTPWRPVIWAGNDWPGHNWGGGEWEGTDVSRSYGSPISGSAWYGAWE